jgi:hypothetical protein
VEHEGVHPILFAICIFYLIISHNVYMYVPFDTRSPPGTSKGVASAASDREERPTRNAERRAAASIA